MSEPIIASRHPTVLQLEPGDYWWCACGKSAKQPFCDGAHKGSGFHPVQVKVDAAKKVALCNCKHTANPPFCDGSHAKL